MVGALEECAGNDDAQFVFDGVGFDRLGGVRLFAGGIAVGRIDQGVGKQFRLFGVMGVEVAAGRRRGARTPGVVQALPGLQAETQVVLVTNASLKNFVEAAERSYQIIRTWHEMLPGDENPNVVN